MHLLEFCLCYLKKGNENNAPVSRGKEIVQ